MDLICQNVYAYDLSQFSTIKLAWRTKYHPWSTTKKVALNRLLYLKEIDAVRKLIM